MDNKKIIEIGSGNGNFSKLLSKKFNSSYIYGIDIVSQYIDFSKKNNNNYNRYGISVGKKVGNAVIRNKLKRQIKDILRKNNINYSKDYVIIVKKAILFADYNKMKIELLNALKEIEHE